MITVLAGGMGAARFLRGLVRVVPPSEVTVIGNTGDDIDIYGVHVSPDLDIVTFMLAGVLDEQRQFGLVGDTHTVMEELAAAGQDTWFTLGDRDYAVCLSRTLLLEEGVSLSEATARICRRFGLDITLLPMTDDLVFTTVRVRTSQGEADIHFQEYWVRHRALLHAIGVTLEGGSDARPAPGVLDALASAEAVIVAPSNPIVSIGTILAVPGIRETLRATRAPVVGVSPIVGGEVVRGMADKLLPVVGAEVSARGVAGLYRDFLNGFVIDNVDASGARDIETLGVQVEATQTMMHTPEDAA
ncbi:MAG TPA: 2-phospho-L-lactate transferase, partial [Casimicrobiaceae bacterium]|nr:2-phospho-L-lactate transferase [Casimicrobiaceae bacterium]